jgi:hypothetical protein
MVNKLVELVVADGLDQAVPAIIVEENLEVWLLVHDSCLLV